jgi:hypothetical protein
MNVTLGHAQLPSSSLCDITSHPVWSHSTAGWVSKFRPLRRDGTLSRWSSSLRDMTPAYLRPWRRRSATAIALAVTATLLIGVVIVLSPRFILTWDLAGTTPPTDRAKAINDIRTALLQGLAGVGLLLGVVFTWRQIQVTRQGHAGDRFTTAVQHLADENIDIRVAGIYALETLAATYATERDAVVDVLSTFVRRHASVPLDQRRRWVPATDVAGEDLVEPLQISRPDIAIALRVLARRTPRRGEVLHLDRLAVPSARLEFARLANADLHYSDLRTVDLQGATLRHADLTGSNLTRARISLADLRAADLRQIVAGGLVAEQADLRGADLSHAYLTKARLGRARLFRADLRGADLTDADLADVQIAGALADDTTTWPAGYDWRSKGIITDPDAPPLRPTGWTQRPPSGA